MDYLKKDLGGYVALSSIEENSIVANQVFHFKSLKG
jgi:hypothetical protein